MSLKNNAQRRFYIVGTHLAGMVRTGKLMSERFSLDISCGMPDIYFNQHAGCLLKGSGSYWRKALNQRDAGKGRHGNGRSKKNSRLKYKEF